MCNNCSGYHQVGPRVAVNYYFFRFILRTPTIFPVLIDNENRCVFVVLACGGGESTWKLILSQKQIYGECDFSIFGRISEKNKSCLAGCYCDCFFEAQVNIWLQPNERSPAAFKKQKITVKCKRFVICLLIWYIFFHQSGIKSNIKATEKKANHKSHTSPTKQQSRELTKSRRCRSASSSPPPREALLFLMNLWLGCWLCLEIRHKLQTFVDMCFTLGCWLEAWRRVGWKMWTVARCEN